MSSTITVNEREAFGRVVRESWVRWARQQPEPKPSWLVPYDDLQEQDKEADRQIGEQLASIRDLTWRAVLSQGHPGLNVAVGPRPTAVIVHRHLGLLFSALNSCRIALARRKSSGTATPEELELFAEVQEVSFGWIDVIHPSPPVDLEYLEQLEQRLEHENVRSANGD